MTLTPMSQVPTVYPVPPLRTTRHGGLSQARLADVENRGTKKQDHSPKIHSEEGAEMGFERGDVP